ncbi:MAG TPA: lipid-transfer protein [Solirubrobacterales bacterium]|nr:lipid-transfer protein [Solirubrobacterales bacterium]
MRSAYVVGVGMTKFEKPGRRDWDYPEMARMAAQAALDDAGVPYDAVEQAAVGFVYADSTSGERALYELGLTGLPVQNVNNNCSSGSTALFNARQAVAGGFAECALALGFERMKRGSLPDSIFADLTVPAGRMLEMSKAMYPDSPPDAPMALILFGNAGREHMERYGTTLEQFAAVAVKNHQHSTNNPYAQFQDAYTAEEVLAPPFFYGPLTKLQCSPTSDGAGAAVIASAEFVERHGLQAQAVEIAAQSMVTDMASTFDSDSAISLVGSGLSARAAADVYEQAGVGPEDVDVIELHDCFAPNELITYEALGLCEEGEAGRLIDEGVVDYGGKWVVNPSGGLISKGHPLGATGLAQCAELNWQLRGRAEARQVDGARVALQHNIGLGGAAVVTIYKAPV